MSLPVAYHPAVKQELADILEWYESQQPGLSELFAESLFEAEDRITFIPEGFEKKYKNMRQIQLRNFPYVLVYEVFPKLIMINRLIHTSRHPRKRYKK